MQTLPERQKPGPTKRVNLMITCLCDAFFDEAAKATVEVLEAAGCSVVFPEAQTCCGQPAFNSGDWPSARRVLRQALRAFPGEDPIVLPSGSCTAMALQGAALAFEKEKDLEEVRRFGRRCWELSDFLVFGLGLQTWTGTLQARAVFHRSCHLRGSRSVEATLQLLSGIQGLELLPFAETEQCCGFGGTFSVSFPYVSTEMGRLKLGHLLAPQPDFIFSCDMSCLMHLGGLAQREGKPRQMKHVAEVLRDAKRSKGGV